MNALKRKSNDSDENLVIKEVENIENDEGEVVHRTKKRRQVAFDGGETDTNNIEDEGEDLSQVGDVNVPDQAEVGIIEKVSVMNFMCHKRLEVNLGANVNFIIGRNGSGKSAILTGLIVGLGGNASTTSRGNSLKGFIKEGCSAAYVSITLRNRGSDAYKPDEYGNVIIIERRLTLDGSGNYKIKSADNKVVSTRKDELMEILDQFNIQIDNPVSILTQDTSRSFLNASNEKDKYAFFLKATQLEQMSSDYQLTIEEKERTKEMLNKKRQIIPDLFEQVKINEEKYKDMQQLQKMESHVQDLKKELAWAMVAEQKLELDKAKEVEDGCTAKIPNYEKHVDDTIVKENEICNCYVEKGEEMNSFNDEVKLLINEKTELHINYKNMRKAAMKSQEQCKRNQRDIHSMEKDRTCLLSKIEEIKNTAERDRELEQKERETQLEEKKIMCQQHESQLSIANHHLHQIDMMIKRNQEQKYKQQNDMRDKHRQVETIRKRIVSLQTRQNDRLSSFGKSTYAILKAINSADRQKKFHNKPVGPLGSFITVKDIKWTKAVEQCIKATMCAYACHDNHDMLLLKDIFKRTCSGRYPSIIVSMFAEKLYDTSQYRPTGYTPIMVVLDMLNIENHIAENTLIDQCSIETVLLIENPKEAQEVMWNIRPRGTNMAISIEGHEIIGGRSSKYYPCRNKEVQYLQRDAAESLQKAEEELVQVQIEQQDTQQKIQSVDAEIRRDKLEHDKTRKRCSNEQDLINNVIMEIKELEAVEEEKLPDVDALETEVEECDKRIMELNANLTDLNTCYDERMQEVRISENQMKDCDERCQIAGEKLESLKDKISELENQLSTLKGHKIHYKQKLSELLAIIENATKNYQAVLAKYENTHSQASKYCEERETNRSVQSLESEILKAQKRINNEELKRGNVADISEKYQNALQCYDKAKKEIDNCIKFRKAIDRAIKHRAKRFADFQKFIVVRAVRFFQMLLSQRGYTGKLKFDHENETLTVQVNVEKAQGTSTKDSKALSGGERSFSTICFIMALWEAMEAPFRCLDEFDVFMDMLNRRISMNMLMKIAKEQQTRQFILLTPQDMSSVQGSDRVRIFRLTDPERGQQTIPFQPM